MIKLIIENSPITIVIWPSIFLVNGLPRYLWLIACAKASLTDEEDEEDLLSRSMDNKGEVD
jgi:hypothetical protein